MKGAYIDSVTCIGCGLCAQLCPKIFTMQDDGKSKVIKPDGDEECSQNAIDACPVTAISWKEYSDEDLKA